MRVADSSGVVRADVVDGTQFTGPTQLGVLEDNRRSLFGTALEIDISPAEARAIAKEAYTYGFPLVESYRRQHGYFVDRLGSEFKGRWNEIHHDIRDYAPHMCVLEEPNPDTPCSYLGADLRAEPLVLTIPPVERDRFYSVQFVDMYTFNFAYIGTRATDNDGGYFLLAGPRWKGPIPRGITAAIRCETDLAFVRYRTQLFGLSDVENVKMIQSAYRVQPLSAFLGTTPPLAPAPSYLIRPLNAAYECMSLEFFNVLNFILQFCPVHRTEGALRSRLCRLGIGAGLRFDAEALSPDVHMAVLEGIADAWRANDNLENAIAVGLVNTPQLYGSRGTLKNNYAHRMVGALEGMYGDSVEEITSVATWVDADNCRIDTATNRYVLRFEPGELPRVASFWSLTLYELPSLRLMPNRYDRYRIDSTMLPRLKRDADSGLTIVIQHDAPDASSASNWLPAPAGRLKLVLRLYAPRPGVQRVWQMPTLQRIA